jgi:hypothetical protein
MTSNAARRGLDYTASLGLFGLGLLGLCALAAPAEELVPYDSPIQDAAAVQTPESSIRNWPERPRAAARALIAKYGEPTRFSDDDLVWFDNGPWRKTVVYRDAPQGFLHAKNILEQSISYDVPPGKLAKLKSFDGGLSFDKKSGELTSRAETETLNFLVLNLADEIVTDKRSPDESRDFYRKTLRLSESGKTSAYMGGFLFPLPEGKSSRLNPEENPNVEPKPTEPPYDGEIQSLDPPASTGTYR